MVSAVVLVLLRSITCVCSLKRLRAQDGALNLNLCQDLWLNSLNVGSVLRY